MAVEDRRRIWWVFLLLAALLLSPFAHAYSVDDAQLFWYEYQIKSIAPNTDLPGVVLNLKLSNDFQRCWDERPLPVCALILDTDGLVALDNYRLDVRDRCRSENNTILCTTVAGTLNTPNGSIRIAYVGQASTQRGITGTKIIPLTLDTTAPSVASIRTGACDASACFIAANVPSPITITFADNRTSFDWRLVFLGRDGSTSIARASACTGTVCTAQLITPCQDGQEFTLALTSAGGVSSREDAQNLVKPFAGQRVVCKTQGPRITNLNITGDGIADQLVSGGTLFASARVTGGVGEVTATVATNGVLGENSTNNTVTGTCVAKDDDARDCTWQLSPLKDGTFTLSFTAIDALGLYSTRQEKVTVLRLVTGNGTGAANVVSSRVMSVSPESINRMALDLARSNHLPYPVYVQYALDARSSVRVHEQKLDSCVWRLPDATNWSETPAFFASPPDSKVFREHGNTTAPNRLDLQIRADRKTLSTSDTFEANCTIAVVVQDGNTLYGEPEKESLLFTIHLRETELGQPGSAFVSKIKREEDKLKGPDQKMLLNLREIRATMDGVCSIMEGLNTLTTTGTAVEGVGLGLESTGYLAAIGKTIANAGNAMRLPGTKVQVPLWQKNDGSAGFLKKVCMQVNCRDLDQTKDKKLFNGEDFLEGTWADDSGFTDSVQSGSTSSGNAGQYALGEITKNLNAPNVQDSFVMSALHFCVGGMIYNAGKWQDINCGYLQCLKEQSLNGQSTAVCEQGKNYKLCTQFVGEVFELPFLRVVKNIAENINGIVQNLPAYVLKWVGNTYCKGVRDKTASGPNWLILSCHAMDAVTHVTDFTQQTKQGFEGITQPDNNICLEALCSAEDAAKGKCKTTFNRVQQYQQYTDYLRIETWVRDERAKQTETDKTAAQQIKAMACENKEYCSITMVEQEDQDTFKISYSAAAEEQDRSISITAQDNPEIYQTLKDVPAGVRDTPEFGAALNDEIILSDFKEKDEYAALSKQRQYSIQTNAQSQAITDYGKCGENQKCKDALKNTLDANGITVNDDGSMYIALPKDQAGPPRMLTKEEAQQYSDAVRKAQYWQTFDLLLNVGLKIALDKGYLNWLSTSYWGDWAITETSNQYLTKEGWAENLCNDLKFDLNDNDDGAIYVTDEDSFPRPVGTFAAEVREVRDENNKIAYMYLITILVDNPIRPTPFGVSESDFAQRNSFRVDAALSGEPEPFDLIDGTFDLAFGTALSDGNGPKRALFVLPDEYQRLCITFDKAFPDSTGKTTYCRDIVEDAYNRGSPVPPQAKKPGSTTSNTGSTGSTGGTGSTGDTSTGCFYGSVSGC